MMEDIKASYEEIEAAGWPKRYTHNLSECQVPTALNVFMM